MLSSSCWVSCAFPTRVIANSNTTSTLTLVAIKQIFCAVCHFDFLPLLTHVRSGSRGFPAFGVDPLNKGGRDDRARPGAGTGLQQQPGNGPRIRRIRLLQFAPFDAGSIFGLPYRVMFRIEIMA